MNNCAEESTEIEVIERRYILKRHKRQKYSCKGCNNIITAQGGVKLTPGSEFFHPDCHPDCLRQIRRSPSPRETEKANEEGRSQR